MKEIKEEAYELCDFLLEETENKQYNKEKGILQFMIWPIGYAVAKANGDLYGLLDRAI